MSATGSYSRISRRIWNDAKIAALSKPQPNAQSLFVRLLVRPGLTCIPGLFPARESGLAEELEWPLKGFREAFDELSKVGLVEASWQHGLVWVPNAIKHNDPSNQNMVVHWAKVWPELPECDLLSRAIISLYAWMKGKGEPFEAAFVNGLPNGLPNLPETVGGNPMPNQDQDQEQEQKQDPPRPPATKTKVAKVKSHLSVDWTPSPERLAAISERTRVSIADLSRQVPEWRLYWLPNGDGFNRPDSQKTNEGWERTFSARIDQLISYGKLTATQANGKQTSLASGSSNPVVFTLSRNHDR
jgi:hypothetical protein